MPYYVVFNRCTDELHFFILDGFRYRKADLPDSRLWLPEIKLGLGLWQGVYQGLERAWLRWCDADGKWIPTQTEQLQQLRQERKTKEQERKAKEQAERRVEELAAQLRELGIEPSAGG